MKKLLSILLFVFVGFASASTLSRVKTWSLSEVLTADDLNNEFNNIINHVNGSLGIANIDSTTRVRFDTLDVNSGIRWGSTPAATLGNVLWANGSFHISVSKDSAGIVDKTSDQTIAGTKTFSGTVVLGSAGVAGSDVTMSSHVYFEYLPVSTDSLIATTNGMLTTKFYVDSLLALKITSAAASDTADVLRGEMPDSAAPVVGDSLNAIRTGIDSLLAAIWQDTVPPSDLAGTGLIEWGIAGDTTSPGKFYYVSGSFTWSRADTSVEVKADGLAMDSVNQGALCRFLVRGYFRNDDWNWTPNAELYSDSVTAGAVGVGGQAAPKKMQFYGKAMTADIIRVDIDGTVAY